MDSSSSVEKDVEEGIESEVDGEDESKEEKSQEFNEDPLVAYREAFKTGLEALKFFVDDDSGEVCSFSLLQYT